MDVITKSCATCRWTNHKCSGKCEECENGTERADGESECKCFSCYNSATDAYRYHVPDEDLTKYFKGD